MKNIAIIIQKLQGGGAERTAANLSEILSGKYNVHLFLFDGREIKYPYNGTLHDLKLPPAGSKIGKLLTLFRRIKAVKKLKKENDISTSISLMDGANLVNVFSGIGDRIITSVRIQMSKSENRMKNGKIRASQIRRMQMIADRSDVVVCLSKGVEDDLRNAFGISEENLVTIYNPCDGGLLLEKAAVHIAEANAMCANSITTMGRMTYQKGQWHLIRAFKKVIQQVPDAELYILGDGELKGKLEDIIRGLGLEDHVVLKGFVEAPHAFIMKSKAFVFPSLFEGLGNVLLEAMACGTPCISTDCPSGPREIIAPNTAMRERFDEIEYAEHGILTSTGDKEHCNAVDPLSTDEAQLADAMIALLTNDELQKKYKEKSKIRSHAFEPEQIAAQWEKII